MGNYYNVGTLQQIICSFLAPIFQSGSITPGTPLTPAGLTVDGVDLSLLALNNARRVAEKAHDFYYSKTDLVLPISASGSSIFGATRAGSLLPVGIKRIENVKLPLATGDLVPIEFITDDEWRGRMMREYGRQPWNPNLTLYQLGVSQNNPTCYQQGPNLFLAPASQFSFPISTTLSVIQWLPDYAEPSDSDFFTEFAPDYLQWQGIIECNKLTKWFTQRREGNIDESNLQVEAQRAMESLLAWDLSISGGTTTPNAPPAPAPSPQAQAAA